MKQFDLNGLLIGGAVGIAIGLASEDLLLGCALAVAMGLGLGLAMESRSSGGEEGR